MGFGSTLLSIIGNAAGGPTTPAPVAAPQPAPAPQPVPQPTTPAESDHSKLAQIFSNIYQTAHRAAAAPGSTEGPAAPSAGQTPLSHFKELFTRLAGPKSGAGGGGVDPALISGEEE